MLQNRDGQIHFLQLGLERADVMHHGRILFRIRCGVANTTCGIRIRVFQDRDPSVPLRNLENQDQTRAPPEPGI